MKKVTVIIVIAIVLMFSAYQYFSADVEQTELVFGNIKKADIVNTITSTGTIETINTVEVGTQVSGIISKIFVDYNDKVKRGQLLAVLDTTTLSASVLDAKAALNKVQAQLEEAEAKHILNEQLYTKGMLSELDFLSSKTEVITSKSSVQSAKSALARAETNLGYAFIYSPITGIVLDRSIEEGQTVAASLSAPVLFTIAEDMTNMRILANVDESDIGQIKENQKVEFTVQAYDEKEFWGEVVQIRLEPESVSNVVNYTVVINAKNDDGLLLPGMTATVDFYIEELNDILVVPNTALKYQPSEEDLENFHERMKQRMDSMPDSLRRPPMPEGMMTQNQPQVNTMDQVWYIDGNGNLEMDMMETGLTDGTNTQIIKSRNLSEGDQVLVTATKKTSSSNNNQRNGFGGPPPPMF